MANGYARSGTTTPLTMHSAPPPPPRLPADIDSPILVQPAAAPAPLDLGPPLPAWHSEAVESPRPAPAPPRLRPGIVYSPPPVPPDTDYYPWSETRKFDPAPPAAGAGGQSVGYTGGPESADTAPAITREARLERSAGPGAGKGEVSNPAGTGSSPRLARDVSPGRLPPLRGPAAGVLAWRRGQSYRARARHPAPASDADPRKVGGIGGLGQTVGQAPGFTPVAAGTV